MVIENLFLSAECYDVMIDCAYENPAETYLNYGNVKVNSCVVREMYLLNRGKYNIYYKYIIFNPMFSSQLLTFSPCRLGLFLNAVNYLIIN